MFYQEPQINLQAHKEKEKDKTEIGSQSQVRHRRCREDAVGEVGYATHDTRSQEDASDNLCNDTRLANLGEGPMKDAAEDKYDGSLQIM